MKTLTELFERAEGFETEVIDGIYYRFRLNEDGDRYRTDEFDYQKSRAEWLEKGVEKQYAIRDKLIRNQLKRISDLEVFEGEYFKLTSMVSRGENRVDELMKENEGLKSDLKMAERLRIADVAYINELAKENKELKKEIDHVKDVWIGVSDAKDLIIKQLEKEIEELKKRLNAFGYDETPIGWIYRDDQ